MEHLPGETLDMLDLPGSHWKSLGEQFKRRRAHVKNRWEYYLKPWLLQHYSGTLNLDIRRMLANYLAEHFDDVDSIDWLAVAGQDEFKGHTEVSLHYFFGAYLFQGAKLQMAKKDERATLKHIQNLENERFKTGKLKPVREKVLSRQKDVIEYFDIFVKEKGFEFELYAR